MERFVLAFELHARPQGESSFEYPMELIDFSVNDPEQLEIILRNRESSHRYGVRLHSSMRLSNMYTSYNGDVLGTAEIGSLVQDIIHLMIDEPADPSDLSNADEAGVTWIIPDTVPNPPQAIARASTLVRPETS